MIHFVGVIKYFRGGPYISNIIVPGVQIFRYIWTGRTKIGKNSFYYKGTQIWNSLNASIYTAATLGQFIKHFKYINLILANFYFKLNTCMHVVILYVMYGHC